MQIDEKARTAVMMALMKCRSNSIGVQADYAITAYLSSLTTTAAAPADEVSRITAVAERMAGRIGAKFVADPAKVEAFKAAAPAGEAVNLEDYKNAPSGIGPLAAEWHDKPQRLLYALITALRIARRVPDDAVRVADGEVLITVSGLTGSGKSAVAGEIEIAMRAIGVPVVWDNQGEKNMTHADWAAALDLYKPTVRIAERNVSRARQDGGV